MQGYRISSTAVSMTDNTRYREGEKGATFVGNSSKNHEYRLTQSENRGILKIQEQICTRQEENLQFMLGLRLRLQTKLNLVDELTDKDALIARKKKAFVKSPFNYEI
ncbi:hypothetical protein F2P81_002356 [Scophthalmus maximus]|uniref:Uncharacterized protein n=1 Tax=Scophthalmus maximus TaxID=52904 RepID=A0A6A4TGL5_SCOMX|nr:hypothetical protein F2P81_002356 [Scophthalmus maximus]